MSCHWSCDSRWVKISGHSEQLGPCGSNSHFANNHHSRVKTRDASCIGGFGQTDGRRKFELGIPQSRGASYIIGASYIRDKTVVLKYKIVTEMYAYMNYDAWLWLKIAFRLRQWPPLVASLMSLTAYLVTTTSAECINVLTNIYHEFCYCFIVVFWEKIKLTTATTTTTWCKQSRLSHCRESTKTTANKGCIFILPALIKCWYYIFQHVRCIIQLNC